MGQIVMHIVGRAYLLIRYGKRNKEIADKEYLGLYSMAGRILVLQLFTSAILLLIGCMLLAIPFYYLKKAFTIGF